MVLIIPLFSFFLFLMTYLGDSLKITPFPGIFLIICIFVFFKPFRVFSNGVQPFFFPGDFYIIYSNVTKKERLAGYLFIFYSSLS